MLAIQYVRSVRRYLTARFLGPRCNWIYTSPLGCIRLIETPPPSLPSPRWVRVRPILSGICGSDLATITAAGSPYFSPLTSTPFTLGHEVVGRVEEIGAEVDQVRVGDRVVLEPGLHCRTREIQDPCRSCRMGRPAHCENVTGGIISAGIQIGFCRDTGGGWSQSLVAHQGQLHRVPEQLSDDAAVLAEPFSCCLHAVGQSGLSDDQAALVLGSGTMGLLTVAAIRATGCRATLIAVARYRHQQEWAEKLGANLVIPGRGDNLQDLARVLGARTLQPELGRPTVLGGADVCFDCVGSSRTIDDALRLTRAGGTVVMVGMPAIPHNVDWSSMWYKELRIVGSYTTEAGTFRKALQLLAHEEGRMRGLAGARFPLRSFKAALHSALNTGSSRIVKTVFEIEGES